MSVTIIVLPISFCVLAYGRTAEEYDRIILMADKSLKEGDVESAFQQIFQIASDEIKMADDTTKVIYNMMLGKIYLRNQENEKAEVYLDEAIFLYESLRFKFPSYIDLLLFRAYASDALNKRDEALKWYRKALIKGPVVEHNPDIDNNCYLNIGNIYNERGEHELAKIYYNKIEWRDSLQRVEIHAGYYGSMCDKYLDFAKHGDWDSAEKVNDTLKLYTLARYGETHPFYLSTLSNAGTIQNSLRNYKKAKVPYLQLIDIGKRNSLIVEEVGCAYIRLIELYCNQDSIDCAIEMFLEAKNYLKALNSDNYSEIEPCLYIGNKLVGIGEYEEGIVALEKFLEFCPEYMKWGVPYAINTLSLAYLNVGRNPEVINLLSPLLSQGDELPDNFQSLRPYLHKTLGCSLYVLNQTGDAIYNLNEALRLAPEEMKDDALIIGILNELKTK